jgi:hypothetical protein
MCTCHVSHQVFHAKTGKHENRQSRVDWKEFHVKTNTSTTVTTKNKSKLRPLLPGYSVYDIDFLDIFIEFLNKTYKVMEIDCIFNFSINYIIVRR